MCASTACVCASRVWGSHLSAQAMVQKLNAALLETHIVVLLAVTPSPLLPVLYAAAKPNSSQSYNTMAMFSVSDQKPEHPHMLHCIQQAGGWSVQAHAGTAAVTRNPSPVQCAL
jgi:hypothetical protein